MDSSDEGPSKPMAFVSDSPLDVVASKPMAFVSGSFLEPTAHAQLLPPAKANTLFKDLMQQSGEVREDQTRRPAPATVSFSRPIQPVTDATAEESRRALEGVGGWEKTTKGFGAKMLAKMGSLKLRGKFGTRGKIIWEFSEGVVGANLQIERSLRPKFGSNRKFWMLKMNRWPAGTLAPAAPAAPRPSSGASAAGRSGGASVGSGTIVGGSASVLVGRGTTHTPAARWCFSPRKFL